MDRLITMTLLAWSTFRIGMPDTGLPGRRAAGLVTSLAPTTRATSAGPDHRLQRNHGELGPEPRRCPRPAVPRRDLRQRGRRPDATPARIAQHRRDGRPDQRVHRHARPPAAGRPGLVD